MSKEEAVKENQVSYARILRVQELLSNEDQFKGLIKEKNATVKKKGKDSPTYKVNASVMEIAQKLWDAKVDACTAKKAEIMKMACKVLQTNPKAAESVAASSGDSQVVESKPVAATTESGKTDVKTDVATSLLASLGQVRYAMLTLFLSAEQLSQHDKKPGADKVRNEIKKLVKLLQDDM